MINTLWERNPKVGGELSASGASRMASRPQGLAGQSSKTDEFKKKCKGEETERQRPVYGYKVQTMGLTQGRLPPVTPCGEKP